MNCYTVLSLDDFCGVREEIRKTILEAFPEGGDLLFVALNEAVNNALFHGHRGTLEKKVNIIITRDNNEVSICIRDEGGGFDHRTRKIHTEELRDHGRGLEIMRYCVDCIEFNEDGNEIILRKNIN